MCGCALIKARCSSFQTLASALTSVPILPCDITSKAFKSVQFIESKEVDKGRCFEHVRRLP